MQDKERVFKQKHSIPLVEGRSVSLAHSPLFLTSFVFIFSPPSFFCRWGGWCPPAVAKRICHREYETIYAGVLSNKREGVPMKQHPWML